MRRLTLVSLALLVGACHSDAPAAERVVDDIRQNVSWLAEANLAGDPALRTTLGGDALAINPSGTMDYETAQAWVALLDQYDGGAGYLGHTDWQLPVVPSTDATCAVAAGVSGNSFGPGCTGSALGSLYHDLLGLDYPASVVPAAANTIGPFTDLLPSFYWSSGVSVDGSSAQTFTFATDLQFRNTTRFNYFPVLPMVAGPLGTAPVGAGLLPYTSGPAAGLAVWDATTGITWLADADLARSDPLGITGTASIPTRNGTLTPPLVDPSGSMLLPTAQTWVSNLTATGYAGASATTPWILPAVSDMQDLFTDLGLAAGDPAFLSSAPVGDFANLQPFFYWACIRDQAGASTSPCNGADAGLAPDGVTPMEWSFNLASGFQGTDEHTKQFYVTVYYPGP